MEKSTVVLFSIIAVLHPPTAHSFHWNNEDYIPHVLPRSIDHVFPRSADHVFPRDIGDFMKANINQYVDKMVTGIGTRLGKMGYDPMALPGDVREFSVKDLLGLQWYGKLALYNGTLENLSTMKRDGDAVLTYNDTKLDIDVTMKFDDLILSYKYEASIMNIGPHGKIEAVVSGLQVNLKLEADLKTMKMKIKELHLLNARKIKVNTKGLSLADYVVDGIADCFTIFAKKVILKIAEELVKDEADKVVESIDLNQYIG